MATLPSLNSAGRGQCPDQAARRWVGTVGGVRGFLGPLAFVLARGSGSLFGSAPDTVTVPRAPRAWGLVDRRHRGTATFARRWIPPSRPPADPPGPGLMVPLLSARGWCMGLSEDEQRRLDRLECEMAAQDPRWGARAARRGDASARTPIRPLVEGAGRLRRPAACSTAGSCGPRLAPARRHSWRSRWCCSPLYPPRCCGGPAAASLSGVTGAGGGPVARSTWTSARSSRLRSALSPTPTSSRCMRLRPTPARRVRTATDLMSEVRPPDWDQWVATGARLLAAPRLRQERAQFRTYRDVAAKIPRWRGSQRHGPSTAACAINRICCGRA